MDTDIKDIWDFSLESRDGGDWDDYPLNNIFSPLFAAQIFNDLITPREIW